MAAQPASVSTAPPSFVSSFLQLRTPRALLPRCTTAQQRYGHFPYKGNAFSCTFLITCIQHGSTGCNNSASAHIPAQSHQIATSLANEDCESDVLVEVILLTSRSMWLWLLLNMQWWKNT